MEPTNLEYVATAGSILVRMNSIVRFRPLFMKEHETTEDSWLVGHEPSDTTVTLPTPGIIAIKKLQEGVSVSEAKEAILQECNEDIDVIDFVQTLAEFGLVESIDGQFLEEPRTIGQSWLDRIPIASISWLYSLPLLSFYAMIILAGLLIFLLVPETRAQASDLLWTPSYLGDILSLCILFPLLGLLHELGHLLIARAKNLRGEIILDYRLFYVVFVSRIAGIWKLPRRQRLLIYCAGMGNDCLIAGILAIILLANHYHLLALPSGIKAVSRFIITYEYLNVLWQFQIFMKTDIYHVFVDLTDRHDLVDRAHLLIISMRNYIFRKGATRVPKKNESELIDHEKQDWLSMGYTLLYTIGIVGSCIWLIIYVLPASFIAITGEYALVISSFHSSNLLGVVDGLLSLILESSSAIILGCLWLKDYLEHRRVKSKIPTHISTDTYTIE